MEDKCYWWDRDLRQCMHVNCQITNCDGGTILCNLYQKDFSYIKTSTINEPSSADYIPMTYVETGIKDSGDRTEFPSGAVRDMHAGKGRYDLLPMCVLMRLAKHYEAGAIKYSDRNWEKGIYAHSFADSAFRHFVKYMDGWNDEDHLIAAIWNLCGLAWTEEKKPEYMDIPARMENQNDK